MWIKAKTTEFDSGCDKTLPYNERDKSSWDEVESVIMWVVFIVFLLMVVYIVWFSKKKPLVKLLAC